MSSGGTRCAPAVTCDPWGVPEGVHGGYTTRAPHLSSGNIRSRRARMSDVRQKCPISGKSVRFQAKVSDSGRFRPGFRPLSAQTLFSLFSTLFSHFSAFLSLKAPGAVFQRGKTRKDEKKRRFEQFISAHRRSRACSEGLSEKCFLFPEMSLLDEKASLLFWSSTHRRLKETFLRDVSKRRFKRETL